jgi:hypothetical protein
LTEESAHHHTDREQGGKQAGWTVGGGGFAIFEAFLAPHLHLKRIADHCEAPAKQRTHGLSVRLPVVATHPKPHEELGTASQGWENDLLSDGFTFHIANATIMRKNWKNHIGINWTKLLPHTDTGPVSMYRRRE